jgi:hypothetical protein
MIVGLGLKSGKTKDRKIDICMQQKGDWLGRISKKDRQYNGQKDKQ